MTKAILKGRLDGRQRNRLKGLFDMMYTPRELAEEIGINKDKIYMVYVPLGCPHERDFLKHILINGKEFAEWYVQTYTKIRLASGETFCKTCKKPVKIYNPKNKRKNGVYYILSTCPHCQRKLTKITGNTKGK
jgi:hypothetical protein